MLEIPAFQKERTKKEERTQRESGLWFRLGFECKELAGSGICLQDTTQQVIDDHAVSYRLEGRFKLTSSLLLFLLREERTLPSRFTLASNDCDNDARNEERQDRQ